jgi:hypothetical protein
MIQINSMFENLLTAFKTNSRSAKAKGLTTHSDKKDKQKKWSPEPTLKNGV